MQRFYKNSKRVGLSPPLDYGTLKAYYSWMSAVKFNKREIELWIVIREDEVKDFLDTLCFAGIDSFIYTAKSKDMGDIIRCFEKNGCEVRGYCVYEHPVNDGTDYIEMRDGIKLKIRSDYSFG